MYLKKLSIIYLSIALAASFSLSAFASGSYSFSDDGNTNNEDYNGTNFIGSDGIYVTTDPNTGLPIYKFNQDTLYNEYSGSTSIGTNSDQSKVAIFDGYDYGSTYNGDLFIAGSDVIGNVVTSVSNATVNAASSIEAYDALADNDLNAGVSITDSTFNSDVTIKSSTVNLSSEANVILGSSSQMDSLLSKVDSSNTLLTSINTYLNSINIAINNLFNGLNYLLGHVYIIEDNLKIYRATTDSSQRTVTLPSTSPYSTVTYTLMSTTQQNFSIVDNAIKNEPITKYVNFNALITIRLAEVRNVCQLGFNLIKSNLVSLRTERHNDHTELISNLTAFRNDIHEGIDLLYKNWLILTDNLIHRRISSSSQTVTLSGTTNYEGTSYNLLSHRILGETYYMNLRGLLDYSIFHSLYQITVPAISNTDDSTDLDIINVINGIPVVLHKYTFWSISFNSSTNKFERTQLYSYCTFAGMINYHFLRDLNNALWAYFQYQNALSPGSIIKDSVTNLSNNLTNYQNAEQRLQNQVTSSIQSFVPDLSLLSGFVAISWVSNYLQQCYISLGSFGTVIMIGLLLGVCMQFIGYFRYKY